MSTYDPHSILAHREGEHGDMEGPVHAIQAFEHGKLRVSVSRWAVTNVDDEESSYRPWR